MRSGEWPHRIACLSAESADVCARLGAWDRVVGVTAFADQAGLDSRPILSGFSRADAVRILSVQPNLIFTFSDVQADLTAELIRGGATVVATNPRTLLNVANAIILIGRSIGLSIHAEELAHSFTAAMGKMFENDFGHIHGPRVYFEEWPEPIITGIPWVGEILDGVGGNDVFRDRRGASARDRVVEPSEIIDANPEIIFASWCGRPVDVNSICRRPGFENISAVRAGRIVPIESADILQPGPRLLRGAAIMADVIRKFRTELIGSR